MDIFFVFKKLCEDHFNEMILMIFVFDNLGYVEKMFFAFLSFLNGYESKMECCQGLLFDSYLELLPPVSSCLNSAYSYQN